jgi:hypothetical protein
MFFGYFVMCILTYKNMQTIHVYLYITDHNCVFVSGIRWYL